MGATLAHFLVYAYNTDRKEICGAHTSCDLEFLRTEEQMREKALTLVNRDAIRKSIKGWEESHQVVVLVTIPMVTESPYCFVLGDDASAYTVTGKLAQNDLRDVQVQEFTVTNVTAGTAVIYQVSDFKVGEPTEEALAAEKEAEAEEAAQRERIEKVLTGQASNHDGCTCGHHHVETDDAAPTGTQAANTYTD